MMVLNANVFSYIFTLGCPKVCKTCLNENLCLSCDLAAARYLENGQCLC